MDNKKDILKCLNQGFDKLSESLNNESFYSTKISEMINKNFLKLNKDEIDILKNLKAEIENSRCRFKGITSLFASLENELQ